MHPPPPCAPFALVNVPFTPPPAPAGGAVASAAPGSGLTSHLIPRNAHEHLFHTPARRPAQGRRAPSRAQVLQFWITFFRTRNRTPCKSVLHTRCSTQRWPTPAHRVPITHDGRRHLPSLFFKRIPSSPHPPSSDRLNAECSQDSSTSLSGQTLPEQDGFPLNRLPRIP